MRLIILAASLAIPSSAPATPTERAPATPPAAQSPSKSADDCVRVGVRQANPFGRPAVPRRLDELPPGRLYHTVLRQVGGCVIPAVVHERERPIS